MLNIMQHLQLLQVLHQQANFALSLTVTGPRNTAQLEIFPSAVTETIRANLLSPLPGVAATPIAGGGH